MPANAILIELLLEDGCDQKKGEVTTGWKPINFMICGDSVPRLVSEAIDWWLSCNTMEHDRVYEVIFQYTTVHCDGVLVEESFRPLRMHREGL